MIETEQTVEVRCDIDKTWSVASDFQGWAEIMPGYQSCTIKDPDNSLWALKVGVGAMVRAVKVRVHVDDWAGPERVDFSFWLDGDPVTGSGSYLAAPAGPGRTAMTLRVRIEGSGTLAPMWEAMGGPVLPRFAMGFAEQLKARIEAQVGGEPDAAAVIAVRREGVLAWLRGLWCRLWR